MRHHQAMDADLMSWHWLLPMLNQYHARFLYVENDGQDFHSLEKSWTGVDDLFQPREGLRNAESSSHTVTDVYTCKYATTQRVPHPCHGCPKRNHKHSKLHCLLCLLFLNALCQTTSLSTLICIYHHSTRTANSRLAFLLDFVQNVHKISKQVVATKTRSSSLSERNSN